MRHRQWILLSWLVLALPAMTGEAADRFYENLLRDGVLAAERGETERAARLLELACFGFLEEPPLLARCLTHLALVQAAMDEADSVLATFQRILVVEQRFSAYTRADLSVAERRRFESSLQDTLSAETLARSSLFAHLVPAPDAGPSVDDPEPAGSGEDELRTAAPPPPAKPPAVPPPNPPREVTEAIARAGELRSTGSRETVVLELERLRPLADAHPEIRELQLLTAELAYRLRRWEESRAYFERGGELDGAQPAMTFYYAVTLYETGAGGRAAEVLRRCLPLLTRNAFVESYMEKILGPEANR